MDINELRIIYKQLNAVAHESIQLYLSTPSMNILRALHETFCDFISIMSSYYRHDYIGKILNNSENVHLSYEISSTKTRCIFCDIKYYT